ncbi:hypothetical protein ACLMJK_004248 [Lecanora helva]
MASNKVDDYPQLRKISKESLEAAWWTGAAISSCAIAARAYARWKVFRRFSSDDAFVLLAWISFIAQMSICQTMLPSVNTLGKIIHEAKAEGLSALPDDAGSKLKYVETMSMACSFGFTCTIWSVKASFLIFFKRLGRQVTRFDLIWYLALATTIVGFVTFFPVWSYKCAVGNMLLGKIYISNSRKLEVLALPISLIWTIKMDLRRKLVLGCSLCLTVLVIFTAIIRATVVIAQGRLAILMNILALVVACVASYRALFVQSQKSQRLRNLDHGAQRQVHRSDKREHEKEDVLCATERSDQHECEDFV